MTSKYDDRLSKLKTRRTPRQTLAKSDSVTLDAAVIKESFETKGKGNAARYALGCIEEMKSDYTKISINDGNRISDQLKAGLSVGVETRLQGSVPLNIHIRASSDVDLLVIATAFHTFASPAMPPASYVANPSISPIERLNSLRTECESILTTKYPAANIDTSGSKAISVSGGSLARKVDVVPSHWHDNHNYQQMRQEYRRGIHILDRDAGKTHGNLPFLHMEYINEKDGRTNGNAKRAIRLLKCLSRDSDYDIKLTSYDLACLIYHMDDTTLKTDAYHPLQLLPKIEAYLINRWNNAENTSALVTPDGTRKIVDSTSKHTSILFLAADLLDLIKEIGAEYNNLVSSYSDASVALGAARTALNEAVIF